MAAFGQPICEVHRLSTISTVSVPHLPDTQFVANRKKESLAATLNLAGLIDVMLGRGLFILVAAITVLPAAKPEGEEHASICALLQSPAQIS